MTGDIPPKAECFLRVELGDTVLFSEAPRRSLPQLGPEVELEVQVDIPCDPCQPSTLANITKQPLLSEELNASSLYHITLPPFPPPLSPPYLLPPFLPPFPSPYFNSTSLPYFPPLSPISLPSTPPVSPLIVSFIEVLPKDRKQKEEKTKVLGQAALDLLPYVLGTMPPSDTRTLPLYSPEDTHLASSEEKVRGCGHWVWSALIPHAGCVCSLR